jgi:MSHA biogenesis protein MshO
MPPRRAPQAPRQPQAAVRGFTLIELIISITLIGLLALAAAPLLKLPMAAWMDASRRSSLSHSVEAAHTRFALDLQNALPNSLRLRVVGGRTLLEFMEVRASGRLRAGASGAAQACPATCLAPGANDVLEAACNDACFTSIGPLLGDAPVPGNDWLVLGAQGPGVPGGDPWFGGNVRVNGGIKTRLTALTAAADGQRIDIGAHSFASLPLNRRFYLVAQAVTLECDTANQRLMRYRGYAMSAAQPVAFPANSGSIVATGLQSCTMAYSNSGPAGGVLRINARFGAPTADGGIESTQWAAQFAVVEAR